MPRSETRKKKKEYKLKNTSLSIGPSKEPVQVMSPEV